MVTKFLGLQGRGTWYPTCEWFLDRGIENDPVYLGRGPLNCNASVFAGFYHAMVPLTSRPYCCRLGRNLSLKAASPPFRCAICQVDQEPFEDLMTDNGGGYCSSPYAPWGGPYLCSDCRKKKDAMEGKRSSRSTACR